MNNTNSTHDCVSLSFHAAFFFLSFVRLVSFIFRLLYILFTTRAHFWLIKRNGCGSWFIVAFAIANPTAKQFYVYFCVFYANYFPDRNLVRITKAKNS